MKKKTMSQAVADFRDLIVQVRGVPVILDSDLAKVYGVITGALNQAVKRNRERFPDEFVFVIGQQEVTNLISQIVTASKHGGRRKDVYAFTEHGAIMAAMVLNSPQAVQMSVFVVQAFVAMRSMFLTQGDLAKKVGGSGTYAHRTARHARACDFGYHPADHASIVAASINRSGRTPAPPHRLFSPETTSRLPYAEGKESPIAVIVRQPVTGNKE